MGCGCTWCTGTVALQQRCTETQLQPAHNNTSNPQLTSCRSHMLRRHSWAQQRCTMTQLRAQHSTEAVACQPAAKPIFSVPVRKSVYFNIRLSSASLCLRHQAAHTCIKCILKPLVPYRLVPVKAQIQTQKPRAQLPTICHHSSNTAHLLCQPLRRQPVAACRLMPVKA
jgi:hypothetical protein